MNGVLPAETAILIHFQSVRIVLLVFGCVVVALLALAASQSDFYSHYAHLLGNIQKLYRIIKLCENLL